MSLLVCTIYVVDGDGPIFGRKSEGIFEFMCRILENTSHLIRKYRKH